MRSFIYILLIIISVLSCSTEDQIKDVPKKIDQDAKSDVSIVYNGDNKPDISLPYPVKITKGIYIDPSFSELEQNELVKGIKELSDSIQHIVEFKLLEYDLDLTNELLLSNGFIITKAKSKDALVHKIEEEAPQKLKGKIIGYYYDRSLIPLILIISDRMELLDYKKVIMHETMHSLYIKHVKDPKALMNELAGDTNVNCLTSSDLIAFCIMYDCDYRLLKACTY